MTQKTLKTADDVRREFIARGETIADWCDRHNFKRHLVYQVLNGKNKGRWGESHRAAVMLGMKQGPDEAADQH